ncbi:MAG: carbohydrate kinase [Humibacillus sp.]|nr:carbohydrate kinase [Humibacillus sp.]MDN5777973.1 carbohydrate kinase [Humibacillus sp.]
MTARPDARPRSLVIGEALIDAVTRTTATSSSRAEPGQTVEHVGGSPANVAFGLAALEHDVDLATWLATDERGLRIAEICQARGVGLTPGSQGAPFTSVAHARLDPTGAATYVFDLEWQLAAVPQLETYGHVHIGSIGAVLEPGAGMVRATALTARARSTVSYDPNARPSLMGRPVDARRTIEAAMALSDVVKLSDEDVAWLCPGEELADVLQRWCALGPALMLVTRGGDGTTVRVGRTGEMGEFPAPRVNVVDTVGAGDSFMAGLVSGLLDAGLLGSPDARTALTAVTLDDVRPAVERALATGALTVGQAGAHAPTRADLGAMP